MEELLEIDTVEIDETDAVQFNYPLIKSSDMPEDMQLEITETIVNLCEKHQDNYGKAATLIKESLEEKYDKYWHVLIGEGYGFDITHAPKTLLILYVGGILGVTVWKN